jgi:hypothetical protein
MAYIAQAQAILITPLDNEAAFDIIKNGIKDSDVVNGLNKEYDFEIRIENDDDDDDEIIVIFNGRPNYEHYYADTIFSAPTVKTTPDFNEKAMEYFNKITKHLGIAEDVEFTQTEPSIFIFYNN